MIFLDTETCGLHGMPVLIQWAKDDGPVNLFSPWGEPISETLRLIEMFCHDSDGVVGFNLVFDWFQLCKAFTVFSLYPDWSVEPVDIIDELAILEPRGRDGPCIKPVSACDVMLHARKGPYQSTMDRGDIRIRRVPTALAWQLADELEKRVPLRDIYFARKKDKGEKKWVVYDLEDDDGDIDPNFKDVVLKFAPSSALKALAADALKIPESQILRFGDVDLDDYPEERGYAPFALALGEPGNWKNTWPSKIKRHHDHWKYNDRARQYAGDDVVYTRDLWKFFGSPALGDDDSVLACMVAAVRWKGFKIDLEGIEALKEKTIKSRTKMVERITPNGTKVSVEFEIPTTPEKARIYVTELMTPEERIIEGIDSSTKKVLLQAIAKWTSDCKYCSGGGIIGNEAICACCNGKGGVPHIVSYRAAEVLAARQANYEEDFYDKLLLAKRFHVSLKIIGTLSSRMAGADGLNAQGVKHEKYVRMQFPLAFENMKLCGGDFDGFEVTLADAAYGDPDLRTDLKSGKKIHALFGVFVFPDMTYEEILATAGSTNDIYDKCKKAVFAMFYGGEAFTLKDRLGVDIEIAAKAREMFGKRYKRVGIEQKKIEDAFCSMRQPGGLGGRVEWHPPAEFVESLFGFKRYYMLENMICKALYDLANRPPKAWQEIKIRVQRRERYQLVSGACQSALYGAAFGLQASNKRSAANHVIQSSGATVTKKVQRRIWDHQPVGVSEWIVQPMNVHDEIMCPTKPGYEEAVKKTVDETVESIRPKVPLIKMEWKIGMKNWASK